VPLDALDFDPDTVRAHLEPLGRSPCLLGLSGGGDSMALLLMAASWARQNNIQLIPVIIDHGLREESAEEAEFAAQRARELGLSPQIIRWNDDKPTTGLQAAARAFRLRTFARVAHEMGAKTLLLGHTQDDQAETVWMRIQAGGGPDALAGMSMFSPLPLWPQGRGISIFRPLLATTRSELRAWLVQQGEIWVDDPSNESRAYTRIRNRQTLAQLSSDGFDVASLCATANKFRAAKQKTAETAAQIFLQSATLLPWGGLMLEPLALEKNTDPPALRVLDAARAAASGDPVPRPDAAKRILAALRDKKAVTAGGAALTYHKGNWYLVRDPGAISGRADKSAKTVNSVNVGSRHIWDGRFAIPDAASVVTPLGKVYHDEIKAESLSVIPALARPGLPVIRLEGQNTGIPGLSPRSDGMAQSLAVELVCRNLFEDRPPTWFDTQLREQTAQGSH